MKNSHVVIGAFFLAGALSAQAQENYALWGKSRPITINTSATGANITADTLYDFPLLVRLDSTHAEVFTQAKSGGADLRFRRFPGPALRYKIDNWDSAARKAEIWVSVDVIYPGNATQVIHMLWQKSDAVAASSGAAVFDSAKGFTAAWAMGGAAGPRANATPGGVTARPATTAVDSVFTGRSTRGVVGTADSSRGGPAAGGEYFDVSPMPGFAGGFTFSFWVNVSSTAARNWMRFFDFGIGEAADNIFAGRQAGTSDVIFDVFPSQSIIATGTLVAGQWKHYTMTVNTAGGVSALYVDGASAGTLTATYSDVERTASYLGRSNWAADTYFTGKMDEVQVSKVARKPGWAKLSFETQKPGATLLTFGATGAPASVAPVPRSGAGSMRVSAQGRGYLFSLPARDEALRLSVHDARGRAVWSSAPERGATSLVWNGLGANGQPLARGMYFARLTPLAGAHGAAWETRFAHMR
jgi:hypothetical protein